MTDKQWFDYFGSGTCSLFCLFLVFICDI